MTRTSFWRISPFDPHTNDLGQFYGGTSGDDTQVGTTGNDEFDYRQGGNDTLFGGNGDDLFVFRGAFDSNDSVSGGQADDTLVLKGNYTADQHWGANTITGLETLRLLDSAGYSFFLDDNNVAAGTVLTVDGSALADGSGLHIDGSHEADGAFTIYGGDANGSYGLGFGNDIVYAGAGQDSIYPGAGDDVVSAGDGNDSIVFNPGEFSLADTIDGGGGEFDLLTTYFNADASFFLQPTTLTNVEQWTIGSTDNAGLIHVSFTLAAQTVATHSYLFVDIFPGSNSTIALTFDGSLVRHAPLSLGGGAGDDVLTGGRGGDSIYAGSGQDEIHGGRGDDGITGDANIDNTDLIDGGKGHDTLYLTGDTSLFIQGAIQHVETFDVSGSFAYELAVFNETVSDTGTLTIDAQSTGGPGFLHFNGASDLDPNLVVLGGSGDDEITGGTANTDTFNGGDGDDLLAGGDGDDVLTGGSSDDLIEPGMGHDTVDTGPGHDHIQYGAVQQSTGKARDILVNFNAAFDVISAVGVTGIDSKIVGGNLDDAQFSHDLSLGVDAQHLHRHHAVLFAPDQGDQAGKLFLIVETNRIAGYQAAADYVFELVNAHLAQLSISNFETS